MFEGIIALLFIGWLLVMPVLGVIGFFRAGRVSRELYMLRAELARLRPGAGLAEPLPVKARPQAEPEPSPAMPVLPPQAAPAIPAQRKPIPTTPPPPPPMPPRERTDWERLIGANWMIWAGGAALAIGALFLVALAIEAGFFGPLPRTLAAGVFGAGLIAAAFRVRTMSLVTEADNQVRHLPSILAGAGVVSLYGACFAAGALYHFVPALVALVLMAAVSVLAIALAYMFTPAIAAIGLVGAYLAPFFTGADSGSVLPLLPYIALITATGLVLVRLHRWQWLTWISLAGTGLWAVLALEEPGAAADWGASALVLFVGLVALLLVEADARKPLGDAGHWRRPLGMLGGFGNSLVAAHFFWLLAGAVVLLAGLMPAAAQAETAGLVVFAALSLGAAALRPRFALLAPTGAAGVLGALIFWPEFPEGIAMACLIAGIGYGVLGTAAMTLRSVKAPLALPAALMPPVALFIAFWREGSFEPGMAWGLGALLAACSLGAVLDALQRRDPGFKSHPGAGALYALGIILSAVLAPFLVFGGLWLGTAMAVVALGLMGVAARFDLPLIRLAGPVAVALTVGLLVRPGMLRGLEISATPVLNELTLGFGLAIAALALGAYFAAAHTRLARTYQGGALVLGFSLLGLTIRHIAGDGVLYGPFDGMGEASAYAIAYVGMAASLAWRFAGPHLVWRAAEYIALVLGTLGVLVALADPDAGINSPLFFINLLFPAFAMPAMLLAGYASVLRGAGRGGYALWIGAAAMALGFVWVTLEATRAVQGDVTGGLWVYSLGWILYAFSLLFWGVWKRRANARYASLGILLLAIGKVFLIDMASLEGLARAGSFIGLGAALIGTALFYQRYVFGLRGTATEAGADPA